MPTLQIRELPEAVYQSLAAEARREGRSLTQQATIRLRQTQGTERRQERLDALARSRRRLPPEWPSPEDLIRADREQR